MARLLDDGVTQYLSVSGVPVSAAPFAFVGWIYLDNLTVWHTAFCLADIDSDQQYWSLEIPHFNDTPRWNARQGGTQVATATAAIPAANEWHHVCGIEAATDDRRVLLDGGSKGTNLVAMAPVGVDTTTLGYLLTSAPQYPLSGRICEAAIYDLSLWPGATGSDKADEFERVALPMLAVGFSPLFVQLGLVAYWPEIRTDQDLVGGYDMTPFNSPTWADHPPRVSWPIPASGYWLAPAAGGPTVPLDTLAIAGAVLGLTVSPGAVQVALDTLAAVGAIWALGVAPGGVSVPLDTLGLTGLAQTLGVSPGAIAIALDALGLTGTAQTLSVSPGAVSVVLDALNIIGSAQGISVLKGAVSVALDALALAASVHPLTVSAGLTVALDVLGLSGAAQSLAVVPGAVNVALDALNLVAAVLALAIGAEVGLIDVEVSDALAYNVAASDALACSVAVSDALVGDVEMADASRT